MSTDPCVLSVSNHCVCWENTKNGAMNKYNTAVPVAWGRAQGEAKNRRWLALDSYVWDNGTPAAMGPGWWQTIFLSIYLFSSWSVCPPFTRGYCRTLRPRSIPLPARSPWRCLPFLRYCYGALGRQTPGEQLLLGNCRGVSPIATLAREGRLL